MNRVCVIDSRFKGDINRLCLSLNPYFPKLSAVSTAKLLVGVLNNFRCAAVRGVFQLTIISWPSALAN